MQRASSSFISDFPPLRLLLSCNLSRLTRFLSHFVPFSLPSLLFFFRVGLACRLTTRRKLYSPGWIQFDHLIPTSLPAFIYSLTAQPPTTTTSSSSPSHVDTPVSFAIQFACGTILGSCGLLVSAEMSGIANSCWSCLSWCHITDCLGPIGGHSRDGIYETTLADNEREAVSDLLGYLENVCF